MNIIKIRQQERAEKISQIAATLKKSYDNGIVLDYVKLILLLKDKFSISDRTAKDYVSVALFRINLKKEDICQTKTKLNKTL